MNKSEVETFVDEFDRHLDRLGTIELRIAAPLCLLGWPVLWLAFGFRWWTSLLLCLGVLVLFLTMTVRYTNRFVKRKGQEFLRRWPYGTEAHCKAFEALSLSRDFQLKDHLIIPASGLAEKDYKAGLELLELMVREVNQGKDPKAVILETGEILKAGNDFLGEEFLSNCRELTGKEVHQPREKLLASAARMFQVKLMLESMELGEQGKEFAQAVPLMWILYDFMAKEQLKG